MSVSIRSDSKRSQVIIDGKTYEVEGGHVSVRTVNGVTTINGKAVSTTPVEEVSLSLERKVPVINLLRAMKIYTVWCVVVVLAVHLIIKWTHL